MAVTLTITEKYVLVKVATLYFFTMGALAAWIILALAVCVCAEITRIATSLWSRTTAPAVLLLRAGVMAAVVKYNFLITALKN